MKRKSKFISILLPLILLTISCGNNISTTENSSISSDGSSISFNGIEDNTSIDISSSDLDHVLVKYISFSKEEISIPIKSTYQLLPIILPDNATNKNVIYKSSSTAVCSVNERGLIYGWKEGEVTISATTMDGSNLTASYKVIVYKNPVNGLTISENNIEIHVGEEKTINYEISPNNATYKDIEIFNPNPEIVNAKINEGNSITFSALDIGSTVIRISSSDNSNIYQDIAFTSLANPLISLSVSKSRYYINVGDILDLGISYVPTNATNKEIIYQISDEEIIEIRNNKVIALKEGEVNITIISKENSDISVSTKIIVSSSGSKTKLTLSYTYKDIANNDLFNQDFCPSIGSPNLLVVPIWFTNSYAFIDVSQKEVIREDIKKAYIGTNDEVGFRSVKTYYEEDSYSQLHLNATITPWYEAGMKYDVFAPDGAIKETKNLINSVISWYKKTSGISSLADFDFDKNGYIDGIILIYAAPNYLSLNKNSGDSSYSNLWAYSSNITTNTSDVNNPTANAFFWASYDFMYDKDTALNKTNKSNYGYGKCDNGVKIDTHTYIHEMGHMLGLSDYYDYAQSTSPAGGFSMQDANVGGHDPFSKIALGWTDPYVVLDSEELTISTFEDSGDVILLSNSNSYSPFDEYLLIELYSPTGLNEHDSKYQYSPYYPKGVEQVGIRLWHVDARLLFSVSYSTYYLNENNLTTNPYIEGNKVTTAMNNTSDGSRDLISSFAKYNILQFIRNDTEKTYTNNDYLEDSDLFCKGQKFDMYDFNKQFVNKSKQSNNLGALNNFDEFPFSFVVENIANNKADILINKR